VYHTKRGDKSLTGHRHRRTISGLHAKRELDHAEVVGAFGCAVLAALAGATVDFAQDPPRAAQARAQAGRGGTAGTERG